MFLALFLRISFILCQNALIACLINHTKGILTHVQRGCPVNCSEQGPLMAKSH